MQRHIKFDSLTLPSVVVLVPVLPSVACMVVVDSIDVKQERDCYPYMCVHVCMFVFGTRKCHHMQ